MTEIKTTIMGRYTKASYQDGWTSREQNGQVVDGDVRLIDGQLHVAGIIKSSFWVKDEVLWWRVTERQLQGKNDLPSERAVPAEKKK